MEPAGKVLPVYFVADESGSMSPYVNELNQGLASLHDALQRESFAAAMVRFSVIGFADRAHTYLEPEDLRNLATMVPLRAGGLTSYAAAFDQLTYRVSVDIPAMKSHGYIVHRPAVFFLTDGQPNPGEDWRAARNNLLAQPAAPNIVSFGIGDADPGIVKEVATHSDYAYVAAKATHTGEALSKFIESLTRSVISSGQAFASGQSALQVERPEGFTLAVDIV